MKKVVFPQNNSMKRNFLALFLFIVLFSCATAIIFFTVDYKKQQSTERIKTTPTFVKQFKDLFPDLD